MRPPQRESALFFWVLTLGQAVASAEPFLRVIAGALGFFGVFAAPAAASVLLFFEMNSSTIGRMLLRQLLPAKMP